MTDRRAVSRARQRTRRCLLLSLITAGIIMCYPAVSRPETTDDLTFDTGVLSGRGVDPAIAALFRNAPRYLPGNATVTLLVNGKNKGRTEVRFGDDGSLCVTPSLLKKAGLKPPPSWSGKEDCFNMNQDWPRAEIRPEPGEEKLYIVVPQEVMTGEDVNLGAWQHGGTAGMLNYDAQYMHSSGKSGSSMEFAQIDSEAGMNISDWVIRSRQTVTRFGNTNEMNHQSVSAQRSFAAQKVVLQMGQIGLANALFSAGQVKGFQVFPESALQAEQSGAGLVEGVADVQSVAEVRQSGILVYSTTVPAGPFRLANFHLLNTRTDLDVTLTGTDGQVRTFTVPASALQAMAPQASPGISFGAGWSDQDYGQSPLIGTASGAMQLTDRAVLTAGAFASKPYRAAGASLDSQVFEKTRVNLRGIAAQDADHDDKGVQYSGTLSQGITDRLSLSLSGYGRTAGYREAGEALQTRQNESRDNRDANHYQWSGSLSWASEYAGSFSVSVARSTSFSGRNSDYLRGSWNRQFGDAYVGASVEHNTTEDGRKDDRVYLSLSLPVSEGRDINSYYNASRGNARAGARYSDRTAADSGWGLSADRDMKNGRSSFSANGDMTTAFSQLGGSVSYDTEQAKSWSVRASGGVVAHSGGVTLSAQRIGDTFGIARVGTESGVRLETPAGAVKTDWRGYAVLPSLNGYRKSAIQLDTRTLDKSVDIDNAWQETETARGAVAQVNFNVIRTRRVLVEVVMADGTPLPEGGTVFDDKGALVTVVGVQGSVFISDAEPGKFLEIQKSGKTVCTLTLDLPEQAENTELYEKATAVCQTQ